MSKTYYKLVTNVDGKLLSFNFGKSIKTIEYNPELIKKFLQSIIVEYKKDEWVEKPENHGKLFIFSHLNFALEWCDLSYSNEIWECEAKKVSDLHPNDFYDTSISGCLHERLALHPMPEGTLVAESVKLTKKIR